MTILNGNNSLPHIKDTAWLAERQKRLAAFKPDCRHGNDPEQCATCLKALGQQPAQPDSAAVGGPRVMPFIPSTTPPVTGVIKWLREQLQDRRAFVERARKWELVLVALVESGQATFSREDIVVLAFRAFPASFGLKEYAQWPDSTKVYSLIDGERGLARCGWLVKSDKGYSLPRA